MKKHWMATLIFCVLCFLPFTYCNADSNMPTFEKQILVNENGITITAKEITEGIGDGYFLKVEIRNDNSVPVSIHSTKTSVNDIMISTALNADVDANSVVNRDMDLQCYHFHDANIAQVGQIETAFQIEGEGINFETEIVEITTSAYGTFTQAFDDTGNTILDKAGVRIVELEGETNDYCSGYNFFVENNSGKEIQIIIKDNIVNGIQFSTVFTGDAIEDGKKSYDSLIFFYDELEEKGLSRISTISSHYVIQDCSNDEIIAEIDYSYSSKSGDESILTALPIKEGVVYSDQYVQISVSNLNINNMGKSSLDMEFTNTWDEPIMLMGCQEVRVNGKVLSGDLGDEYTYISLEELEPWESFKTALQISRDEFFDNEISEVTSIDMDLRFLIGIDVYDITLYVPFKENTSTTNKLSSNLSSDIDDYLVETYPFHTADKTFFIYELTNKNNVDVRLDGTVHLLDNNENEIDSISDVIYSISPGEYQIMIFDVSGSDSVSLSIHVSEFTGKKPEYYYTVDDSVQNKLTVRLTNKENEVLKNTMVTVIFMSNGEISAFLKGLNSKLPVDLGANETITGTINNTGSYDSYHIYVNGEYD